MKTKFYSLSMALVALWLFSSIQLSAQTPTITVLQPSDPNIVWTAGGTYVISWIDNFQSTVDVVLINQDSTGTPHYLDTLASNITSSTYYWNTTGFPLGTHYKIRVQNHQSPTVYKDESNHYFTLSDQAGGFITLEQPVGNETWAEGNTYVISWNDNLIAPVRVELLKNNAPFDTLVASTTGSTLNWTIPTGYANSGKIYKIRVSSTVAGATTTPATSGYFKITASAGTTVNILQPNGGESWAQNTTHLISWIDDIPEPVNVELYDGNTWVRDIATGVVGSTYYWTIDNPLETTGTHYRVYVRSTLDPNLYDRSDFYFSITSSAGTTVTVIQPNGSESWAQNTTHLISWNDDIPEPVNVELYNGNTWVRDIATNVVGSTCYWTIDNPLETPGTHYRVYVRST